MCILEIQGQQAREHHAHQEENLDRQQIRESH